MSFNYHVKKEFMNFLQVTLALFFLFIQGLYLKSVAEPIKEKSEMGNIINENFNDAVSLQESYYLLGPGDKLRLIVEDNREEFDGAYTILNDGSATFPLIGQVYLENLSIEQASNLIEKKFSKELLVPQISLTIEETRPIKVAIIGEVNRPGIYSTYEKGKEISTLIDAVRAAGGITPKSNLTNVTIKRRLPGHFEKYKIAKLDLFDLIYTGNQLQNPFLLDRDIIEIERVENLPKNIVKTASSTLSPKTINVTIVGEVEVPGALETEANTPLLQAVLKAGGLKSPQANRQRIELIRLNNNGSVSRLRFKYNLSKGISKENNPPLINGDVVKVYPTNLTKFGKGINSVTNPLTGLVNAVTLFRLLD